MKNKFNDNFRLWEMTKYYKKKSLYILPNPLLQMRNSKMRTVTSKD